MELTRQELANRERENNFAKKYVEKDKALNELMDFVLKNVSLSEEDMSAFSTVTKEFLLRKGIILGQYSESTLKTLRLVGDSARNDLHAAKGITVDDETYDVAKETSSNVRTLKVVEETAQCRKASVQ